MLSLKSKLLLAGFLILFMLMVFLLPHFLFNF